MVSSSTKAKAVLTIIIVAGFTVAYTLAVAASFAPLEFLTDYGSLLFWIAVVTSVVLFVWRVLPRWLIALGWASLAVYLLVIQRWPPSLLDVYLVIFLFALFLIFLATWIHDVRRARRVARRLDERTLAELRRVEGAVAETRGSAQTQLPRGAPTQALLRLDPATVQALGDVADLGRQIKSDRDMGFPMDWDRVLESINKLETRMAISGVRRSWTSIASKAADILVGGAVAFLATLVVS